MRIIIVINVAVVIVASFYWRHSIFRSKSQKIDGKTCDDGFPRAHDKRIWCESTSHPLAKQFLIQCQLNKSDSNCRFSFDRASFFSTAAAAAVLVQLMLNDTINCVLCFSKENLLCNKF